MRTSALFDAKTLNFSKFMVCLHGQVTDIFDGHEHFTDKGCQIFLRFCTDVLYGRPLAYFYYLF